MLARSLGSRMARGGTAAVCCIVIASCGGDSSDAPPRTQGISVQAGLKDHMQSGSDSQLVVREADNIDAAADGLRTFRQDLWKSQLFASLDGQFGKEQTPAGLR